MGRSLEVGPTLYMYLAVLTRHAIPHGRTVISHQTYPKSADKRSIGQNLGNGPERKRRGSRCFVTLLHHMHNSRISSSRSYDLRRVGKSDTWCHTWGIRFYNPTTAAPSTIPTNGTTIPPIPFPRSTARPAPPDVVAAAEAPEAPEDAGLELEECGSLVWVVPEPPVPVSEGAAPVSVVPASEVLVGGGGAQTVSVTVCHPSMLLYEVVTVVWAHPVGAVRELPEAWGILPFCQSLGS